jgi:phosphatidylglycerophosphate synthase
VDSIPARRAVATLYRVPLSALEKWLYLPAVSPSVYSALGVILSVLFLHAQGTPAKIAVLVLVLAADWLDGATARRHHMLWRTGYIVDVVADRISEALIFASEAGTIVGQIFLLLWLVNVALTVYSIRSGKHSSLALRGFYLATLLLRV